jgi:multidrug transporter EmrE-like cation transporter
LPFLFSRFLILVRCDFSSSAAHHDESLTSIFLSKNSSTLDSLLLSTALARLKFVEAAHETTYINAKGEPPMHWLYLYTAIILEVCGTLSLRASNQFSNKYALLIPLFYIASFYLLSKAMAQISISIAYAVWSGAGIVALAVSVISSQRPARLCQPRPDIGDALRGSWPATAKLATCLGCSLALAS